MAPPLLRHAPVVATDAVSAPLKSALATSQISTATGACIAPKPKKKRSHSTPTRDRERRELLALRVEVVELEKQLQQARERLAMIRKKNREKIAASGSRIVSVAPAWRHIAQRHLRARQAAETENRRLREQVQDHLKWGNALQAKMSQRTAGKVQGTKDKAAAAALGTVAHPLLLAEDEEGITDLELELDDADRAELEMLVSGLDKAYARTESVFEDHDIGDVPLGAASASRTTMGGDHQGATPYVELRDARVIPFDFRLAIDAVWNAWVLWHLGGSSRKSVSAQRSCSYPDVARPEHTFAVKFRLQCAAAIAAAVASPVFLDMKLVLRRYVEQDRMVLVWRGISEGENELDGLSTDETGWVAIDRMTPFGQAGDQGQTPTETARASMRSCVRMTPKRAEDCTAAAPQAQTLADLVVNSYEEDVSFIYREMEAQLLRVTRHV